MICFKEAYLLQVLALTAASLNVREQYKASLLDILRFSLFKTKEELLTEIDIISSSGSTKKTGTRIIIWNLRRFVRLFTHQPVFSGCYMQSMLKGCQ